MARNEPLPEPLYERLLETNPINREAWNEFDSKYAAQIRRAIPSFINDSSCKDEIVQKVRLEVRKQIHNLESLDSFAAWLRKITYRTATKAQPPIVKGAQQDKSLNLSQEEHYDPEIQEAKKINETVRIDTDTHIIREKINECLQQLKPLERDVVVLRHFKQCSYDETAVQLGITPNYAGVILNRAHKKLAELLPPEFRRWLSL